VLLHPIDDPGGIRERDVEQVREPAHRHRPVVLEQPQDVHLRHADVALDELAHRRALELADPPIDFCQDGVDRRGCIDTSHVVKHSTDVNDFVNVDRSITRNLRCALR
jgi:hypothetical protein